jgi:hypothetical protein
MKVKRWSTPKSADEVGTGGEWERFFGKVTWDVREVPAKVPAPRDLQQIFSPAADGDDDIDTSWQ